MTTSNVNASASTGHITAHTSGIVGNSVSASSQFGFGNSHKQISLPKCSFHLTSSTKCGDPVIPLTKFCIKHILEDTTQVLFRICGHVPINSAVKNDRREEESCVIECPVTEDFEG